MTSSAPTARLLVAAVAAVVACAILPLAAVGCHASGGAAREPLASPRAAPAPPSDADAALIASARPEIEAANAAWLPGLRHHDAAAIVAAYADSGVFVTAQGATIRGREAIARMYEERFPLLGTVRDGAVVQEGLVVVDGRIYEWGHATLETAGRTAADAPVRRGGSYLTVWERDAASHWRIVRNLAF